MALAPPTLDGQKSQEAVSVAIPGPSKTNNGHGNTEHTPLRLAEKHYKNRSLAKFGLTPSLRADARCSETQSSARCGEAGPSFRRRQVVDLGRPDRADDDEVHQAGWWSPESDTVERYLNEHDGQTGGLKGWLRTSRKGKARDLGERPGAMDDVKRVRIGDKWGYVVSEGT